MPQCAEWRGKCHRSYKAVQKTCSSFSATAYVSGNGTNRGPSSYCRKKHRCGTTTPRPPHPVPLLNTHLHPFSYKHAGTRSFVFACAKWMCCCFSPVRHIITNGIAFHSPTLYDSTLMMWCKRSDKFQSWPWFLTN